MRERWFSISVIGLFSQESGFGVSDLLKWFTFFVDKNGSVIKLRTISVLRDSCLSQRGKEYARRRI